MTHVLVSGANGFVGQVLTRALVDAGCSVTGLVRRAASCADGVAEWVHGGKDFAGLADVWPQGLRPDCVVHLAARVHVMHDDALDPDAAFRATNVEGTLRLAAAARQNGARRFVFVSSIKAVAESDGGRPLREDDDVRAEDAYGRSKREAEQALIRYGDETGLDVVIVRPPLVYGPQVRANFLRLMDGIWRGMPLPLGTVRARRSLVYVGNLADALVCCATDPRAAHQCFHVADSDDSTVAELARMLGRHLQKPARLFPVPVGLLQLAGRLTGRLPQIDRLIGSLQVDTTRIRTVLGWQPRYSTDDGLAATARWYRSTH
ncbi:UDP-glucose 4-epimerase family protein [Paraburkholderia megapolitana]|uniref:UDP-glucose 4-epimerase n=1 Tax=Paraburkholderia megapolitana TaxID=420953 RepID=A0A1I3H1I7_9BURK|nr:SDR family oxidoreductase [Paraburkholderia megapolitana]QDQ83154.1 SDR family oxidoreductase [Paraburkholderia megapolitana]SFI29615.1 UDP-glucose 4-epimerase [Paraburkholderia megapolitana]